MKEDKPVFYMGAAGALMCDRPIDGLTQVMSGQAAEFYRGDNFVGESINRAAAKKIAEALGGVWEE